MTAAPVARGASYVRPFETLAALAVALSFAGIFVAVAAAHGALGAARNDDWAYQRIAFDLARTGHLRLNGGAWMMLVGQVVAVWPVVKLAGAHVAVLQVSVAASGALAIALCFVIMRRFLSSLGATIACCTLLVGPLFGALSVSFMTDVPAFAAQALTLYLGLRALEQDGRGTGFFVASAAVGVFAFSVREQAVVAFVVVVAAAVLHGEGAMRRRTAAIAAAFAVLLVLLFAWRRSLPNGGLGATVVAAPSASDLRAVVRMLTSLALFVSPVALAISPTRALARCWSRTRVGTVAAVGAVLGAAVATKGALQGNYVTRWGSYPGTTAGGQAPIMPELVYLVVKAVALYSLAMALLVMVGKLRDGPVPSRLSVLVRASPALTVVSLFTAGTIALYALLVATTAQPVFDRYLIAVVPFVAGLLLYVGRRDRLFVRWRAAAVVALAAYAALGMFYIDNSAAVDGTKWRASEHVVAQGVAPRNIDGGLEWYGFHQTANVHRRDAARTASRWTRLFPPRPLCATVVLRGHPNSVPQLSATSPVLAQAATTTLFGRRVVAVARAGPDTQRAACRPSRP